jgi:hypothetical protein
MDRLGTLLLLGGLAGLAGTWFLRARVSEPTALGVWAAFGCAVGAGALVLVGGAGPWDWVAVLAVSAVAIPAHVRYLLCPPERPGGDGG